jgi:hypothetical protein
VVAGVAGLADGSFDGKADESDVGFSVIGFAEMALVGLTVVAETGWGRFVVGVNDVGFADGSDVNGFAVGTAVDGLDDGLAVDGTDESFDVGVEVVEHGGSVKQEKGLIF